MTHEKKSISGEKLYKVFIYVVLLALAITIIVPVAWVFLASIKQNSEFYGNPWALPAGFYWQNFTDAWNAASMGSYMLNSVLVTALSLVLLLVIALPAAYCLARFHFRGRNFLNTCFMAGLFINVNYIVVPIFLMLRDGGTWLNFYFGYGKVYEDGHTHAQEGLALSKNLVDWEKVEEPVIPYGASGSIDSGHAHKASIVCYQGTLYHFYCGTCPWREGLPTNASGEYRGICLAASKPLEA